VIVCVCVYVYVRAYVCVPVCVLFVLVCDIFRPTTQVHEKMLKEHEMQYHMKEEEENRQQKQSAKLPCESLDTSFAGIGGACLSIISSAPSTIVRAFLFF